MSEIQIGSVVEICECPAWAPESTAKVIGRGVIDRQTPKAWEIRGTRYSKDTRVLVGKAPNKRFIRLAQA